MCSPITEQNVPASFNCIDELLKNCLNCSSLNELQQAMYYLTLTPDSPLYKWVLIGREPVMSWLNNVIM